MALGNKAFRGGIWLSSVSYTRFGISFVVQIILARILAPEIFGEFAVIAGLAEVLFIFAGFSPPFAVIRYQYCDDIYPTALRLAWLLATAILFTVLLVIIFAYLSGWISSQLLLPCAVLILAKVIRLPASIHEVWIEKNLNYRIVSLTILAAAVAGAVAGLGSAVLEIGIWVLVFKELAEALLYHLSMHIASKGKATGNFNSATARSILRYGAELIGSRLAGVLYARSPALLLGANAGSLITGLYDRANYLATVQNTVLTPVTHRISMAVYGKVQHDPTKLSEALHWHLFVNLRWSLPVGLVLFVFAEELLTLLLGEPWRTAAPFLTGLALWVAFQPACASMQVCSQSIGVPSAVTVSNIIGIVGIMGGFLWGTMTDHWPAIAWANSITVFIRLAYLSNVLITKNLNIEYKKLLKYPFFILIIFGAFLTTPIVTWLPWWLLSILIGPCWIMLLVLLEQKEFLGLKQRLSFR